MKNHHLKRLRSENNPLSSCELLEISSCSEYVMNALRGRQQHVSKLQ